MRCSRPSTAPRPGRCYLALQILAALVGYKLLDNDEHQEALQALRRCLARPDLNEPIVTEHSGVIASYGSLGSLSRQLVAGLIGPGRLSSTNSGEPQVILEVPDTAGQPITLIAPAGSGQAVPTALEYQIQFYSETKGREIAFPLLNAVRNSLSAASAAGVPVPDLLAQAGETGKVKSESG